MGEGRRRAHTLPNLIFRTLLCYVLIPSYLKSLAQAYIDGFTRLAATGHCPRPQALRLM